MGFWKAVDALTRRELRSESRSAEVLLITIPFGVVALLVVPLGVGTDVPLLERLGPGIFWVVVLLFATLVGMRQSAVDTGARDDLIRLLGVDPAARFVARSIANAVLLLVFQVIVGLAAIVLYDPGIEGWWWLAAVLPLAAIGLALMTSLATNVAQGIGGRVALAPLLVVPLAIPVLLGATQAVEGLRLGAGILSWVLLLAIMDIALAVAGVLTARPLESSA